MIYARIIGSKFSAAEGRHRRQLGEDRAYLVHRLRAVHLRLKGRGGLAIAAYQQAIVHAPGGRAKARARKVLAGYYQDLGRLDDAERVYRLILEADPREQETRVRLSEMYLHRGDHDASVAELLAAVAASPETPSLHRLLARARHLRNRVRRVEHTPAVTKSPSTDLSDRLRSAPRTSVE